MMRQKRILPMAAGEVQVDGNPIKQL